MRLGNNASIRDLLTSQAISIILDATLASTYAAILFAFAPVFGLVTLVIAALHVAVLAVTTHRLHRFMQQDLAAQADAQGFAVETINGIETLKGLGAEWKAHERWLGMFKRHLVVSMRKQQLSAVVESTTTTLRSVTPVGLLFAGTQYVLDGSLSLGTILALLTVATMFLTPLGSLVTTAQQLQLVGAQLERIGDVMHAEPEPVGTGQLEFGGAIALDRAGFRYDENSPWVLRDICVRIEPGSRVAVVGASGAGKSTLAKLLLGLYDTVEGEITYDGRLLGSVNRLRLRRQFGTVTQDPLLFNMSVRDNNTLGDPSISGDDVVAAAGVAAIDQDIGRMPAGYNTVVSEGGRTLSGGQRQRLALARAVAARPSVLLLDEATSHLDTQTEETVMTNLRGLACTQIVIAHRLSTVRDADTILVLDGGRLVERGRHSELMALGGVYARLVARQLDSQVT
jgi:ABC-type bacteriocin/lantibiotic exporter with double-glycine peptidase domain